MIIEEKERLLILLDKRLLDTELNLTNNYKQQAYKDFNEFRELVEETYNRGYLSESKHKKYLLEVTKYTKIFEPSEDDEEEEVTDRYAFFRKIANFFKRNKK